MLTNDQLISCILTDSSKKKKLISCNKNIIWMLISQKKKRVQHNGVQLINTQFVPDLVILALMDTQVGIRNSV